ncbi:TPA: glycosyltransferase family 8 protein [Campylobacter coli]|nr:glycosyltransferase family 8 protein [Campylobacter coli]HEE9112898.1 glycosyltransferase family 8 protein [Campylobacter coli]HEE9123792.1 glycosyltransferase family 8 protein [Campylobacter coli]HEE9125562.1 glycosyltransferase family 8 protein [Campylobacter coli]HEE9138712.1 glycosyltransferase family 8 protein [Campylobacter coli]
MYNIIFSADENYIKYTAVLITSIIKNTNANNDFLNNIYHFHILSDFLSDSIKEKLDKLQNGLSKIYPCKISIHIMKDDEFKNFPSSGAAHSLKLPYYRLKFISLFDDSIDKCLYLDSDMLCMCDIRELFCIDLKDNIIAVVGDPGSKKAKIKFIENGKKRVLKFDENYFNSGFLLINVKEYKKAFIEQKCEELAKNCVYIKAADQDLLNATISKDKILKLDFAYNFNIITLLYVICKDEKKNRLNYTREEFTQSAKNPKILHYGEKPWKFLKSYVDLQNRNINDYWWDIAKEVPIFKEELLKQKENIKDYLLYAGLGFTLYNLCKKYQLFTIKQLLQTGHDAKLIEFAKGLNDDKYGLYCMLGEMVLYARKHKKGVINIILKSYKMIKMYEKYAYKSRDIKNL